MTDAENEEQDVIRELLDRSENGEGEGDENSRRVLYDTLLRIGHRHGLKNKS